MFTGSKKKISSSLPEIRMIKTCETFCFNERKLENDNEFKYYDHQGSEAHRSKSAMFHTKSPKMSCDEKNFGKISDLELGDRSCSLAESRISNSKPHRKSKSKTVDLKEKFKRMQSFKLFSMKKKYVQKNAFTQQMDHFGSKKNENSTLGNLTITRDSCPVSNDSNTYRKSSVESVVAQANYRHQHDMLTSHDIVNAAANVMASMPKADEKLQQLIDIVMPPLLISSTFDMSKNNDVAELSIIMQQHLNTAVSNSNVNFSGLGMKRSSANENNENIMRNCLDYLEYLNEKHTRERQLRSIRNKVSGVVLLTIVFIIIFGLGFFMSVYLVDSLINLKK
jgi:hypothetical protein